MGEVYLVIVRELVPVRRSFLQEGIPALQRFVGHVRQTRGLSGKHLLSHKAIVGKIESKFQHPMCGRGLVLDCARPLDGNILQLSMVDDLINSTHPVHSVGIVGPSEEKDLPCKFLPDLLG